MEINANALGKCLCPHYEAKQIQNTSWEKYFRKQTGIYLKSKITLDRYNLCRLFSPCMGRCVFDQQCVSEVRMTPPSPSARIMFCRYRNKNTRYSVKKFQVGQSVSAQLQQLCLHRRESLHAQPQPWKTPTFKIFSQNILYYFCRKHYSCCDGAIRKNNSSITLPIGHQYQMRFRDHLKTCKLFSVMHLNLP